MKRRGLIFNSRPDKAAMFALGLMLGLCPVSQAWADTNITDSQVVAQAQKKVKGQVIDATGEPLIGVNISVIGGTEGTITDIDGNYAINVPAGARTSSSSRSILCRSGCSNDAAPVRYPWLLTTRWAGTSPARPRFSA